jgi:GrpB-like predicted nucleotidyltransferase (UPF0157 family)
VSDAFREPVELAEPDPAWAGQYAEEAARIEHALRALAPDVEHIGSTSVPLRAKPIIDIQVTVAGRHVAAAVAALAPLGYAHHGQGGVPGREYLTRRPGRGPAVNVHVFASDNPLLADNRRIRDYLRAHPDAARRYAEAKQRAVDQGNLDLLTYSDAKRAHVAALRDAAAAWARGSLRGAARSRPGSG